MRTQPDFFPFLLDENIRQSSLVTTMAQTEAMLSLKHKVKSQIYRS